MGKHIHIFIVTINYLYREFNPDKDNILTVDLKLKYKFIHLRFSIINTYMADNILWFRGDWKLDMTNIFKTSFTETKYFKYYFK
jgi:hypothetical protein